MAVQVSTRIDEATKLQFDKIREAIGISPANAFGIFIKGVVNHNGIPFPVIALLEKNPKAAREFVFGCTCGQFKMSDDFHAPYGRFEEQYLKQRISNCRGGHA